MVKYYDNIYNHTILLCGNDVSVLCTDNKQFIS